MHSELYKTIGKILAQNGETRALTILRMTNAGISKYLSEIREPIVFDYSHRKISGKRTIYFDDFLYLEIDWGNGEILKIKDNTSYYFAVITYSEFRIYRIKIWYKPKNRKRIPDFRSIENITNFISIGKLGITDLSGMFHGDENFNGKISPNWDTSRIISMEEMFYGAEKFNQKIPNWDTSNVISMSKMFYQAKKFNQNIGYWDVSNVENMRGMFYDADKFNQPIGDWNVSKVINMGYMFYRASQFNQSIGDWNVSRVKNMDNMFNGATRFNQPIGDWNVSRVRNMDYMFNGARQFNQPIKWKTPKLTDARYMFNYMISFRQSVEIDLPNLSMINELSGHSEMDERRVRLTIFPK